MNKRRSITSQKIAIKTESLQSWARSDSYGHLHSFGFLRLRFRI